MLHIGHIVVGTARGVLGRHVQHDLLPASFITSVTQSMYSAESSIQRLMSFGCTCRRRSASARSRASAGRWSRCWPWRKRCLRAAEVLAGLGNLVALIAGNG